jgi:hypothetical protein
VLYTAPRFSVPSPYDEDDDKRPHDEPFFFFFFFLFDVSTPDWKCGAQQSQVIRERLSFLRCRCWAVQCRRNVEKYEENKKLNWKNSQKTK